MATKGASASQTGDKLEIDVTPPAWPQSIQKLGLQGGTRPEPGLGDGDLLIRVGFQMVGDSAAESV